jgi:phosphoglycolate phosphatase-like HAD superfamily hydrolase
MAPILALWDIDHTLIETRGVGGKIYAEAFRRVTGQPLDTMPTLAGRTEPVIFREALKVNGIRGDSGKLFRQFAEEQAHGYASRADELRRQGRALPGAEQALQALAARNSVIQTVLTGNTRRSAQLKLQTFGLARYLDLPLGAYGTDDDTRANLVGIARQRAAEARKADIVLTDTVLIGDTANDVHAARQAGARIVAVATGSDSPADLTAAGADTVLKDLADVNEVISAITGG